METIEYILDKIKNEGELVFEKMPRDCVNIEQESILVQNI